MLKDNIEEYGYNFAKHNDFKKVRKYLKKLNETYSKTVSLEVIRKTSEGRPIYAVNIGKEGMTNSKPVIVIECLMHAREWTAVEACMFFLRYIVKQEDGDAKTILDKYDLVFMPVVNPDGYVYSWEKNKIWRKNRQCIEGQKCDDEFCSGVDGNRNFPDPKNKFCSDEASSTDPCELTFCGTEALSMNETLAVSDVLERVKGRLLAYISVHSAAGMWMPAEAANATEDEMRRVAIAAVNAMHKESGLAKYKVGKASELLYFTVGTSQDYAINYFDAKYSYTIEMRKSVKDVEPEDPRFQLKDEKEILPVIEEMCWGLKTAILSMKN